MNKWLKIILGTILLAGVITLVLPSMPLESWGEATLNLIKGGVTLVVLLIAIILIILGITELKE